MSIEKVKTYFHQYGMENKILEFDVSSATVDLAAQALNCEPCRIAKTLSFTVDDHTILIVMAGDAKIDNSKYKAQFGTKAKMLAPDEAESRIGHAVGGVCPFAVNKDVIIYLDYSLKRFETVFPACGSSNSAIELSIPELEKYSGFPSWVDICKGWNE
ncbi:MAG: YbaK/EbsC family protein [Lachnospiraceae bacterium]|nr:YbaK/EbsC family protein [Lachnospiraceae bacterium]MCI9283869.1 YbaK/EbsC family protein [Lachnospiraceae bacterium]